LTNYDDAYNVHSSSMIPSSPGVSEIKTHLPPPASLQNVEQALSASLNRLYQTLHSATLLGPWPDVLVVPAALLPPFLKNTGKCKTHAPCRCWPESRKS